jgi:hypothetical protein
MINFISGKALFFLCTVLLINCASSPGAGEWEQYADKEYGIDLEYPGNWHKTAYEESAGIRGIIISSLDPDNAADGTISGIHLAVAVYDLEETGSMNTDGLLQSIMGNMDEIMMTNEESTQLYGRSCLHVSLEHTVTYALCEVYVISENDYGYAVMYSFIPSELEPSDYNTLEQILKSIKISFPARRKAD